MKKSILLLMIVTIILSVCACSSGENQYQFHLNGKTERYTLSEIEKMRTTDGRKYEELDDVQVSGFGTIRVVSGPRETNWDVDRITGERTPIGWEVIITLDDGMKITYRPDSPDKVPFYAGDTIFFQGKTFPSPEEILVWPSLDDDTQPHVIELQ